MRRSGLHAMSKDTCFVREVWIHSVICARAYSARLAEVVTVQAAIKDAEYGHSTRVSRDRKLSNVLKVKQFDRLDRGLVSGLDLRSDPTIAMAWTNLRDLWGFRN
ncbi:hypothetical protein Plhal304r1_c016g0059591 [Plasmopara halstedii]